MVWGGEYLEQSWPALLDGGRSWSIKSGQSHSRIMKVQEGYDWKIGRSLAGNWFGIEGTLCAKFRVGIILCTPLNANDDG